MAVALSNWDFKVLLDALKVFLIFDRLGNRQFFVEFLLELLSIKQVIGLY